VDLSPTREQRAVREAFAALFGRQATPERVRKAESTGFDQLLWWHYADVGALGIGVPSDCGGGEGGLLDWHWWPRKPAGTWPRSLSPRLQRRPDCWVACVRRNCLDRSAAGLRQPDAAGTPRDTVSARSARHRATRSARRSWAGDGASAGAHPDRC
jgi:hypothetical protein